MPRPDYPRPTGGLKPHHVMPTIVPHRDISAETRGRNALDQWYAAIDPKKASDADPLAKNSVDQWNAFISIGNEDG